MKILAIEKEVPGVDWSTVSKELLAQEALDVYSMYLMEQLSGINTLNRLPENISQ
jgi:hypothetical protein